jgi:pimeloyl-ACP methyl ester carboxylesterase
MNEQAVIEPRKQADGHVTPAPQLLDKQPDVPIWREMFAGLDWLALRTSHTYYGFGVPRGDGSSVVLVPGCFSTDAYLAELYGWLKRIGYRPYSSGIGLNIECPNVMVERLLETVERAHRETGRKARIVGHSLGGLLARGVAMRRPDLVEQVITVGSPVNGLEVHPAVLAAGRLVGGNCVDECIFSLQAPLPAGVTETSIYSRTDGVVSWRSCIPANGGNAIEVSGTHTGLVFNAGVYGTLARLLATPATQEISRRDSRQQLRLIRGGAAAARSMTTETTVA